MQNHIPCSLWALMRPLLRFRSKTNGFCDVVLRSMRAGGSDFEWWIQLELSTSGVVISAVSFQRSYEIQSEQDVFPNGCKGFDAPRSSEALEIGKHSQL